jgi:hypothetical protein
MQPFTPPVSRCEEQGQLHLQMHHSQVSCVKTVPRFLEGRLRVNLLSLGVGPAMYARKIRHRETVDKPAQLQVACTGGSFQASRCY